MPINPNNYTAHRMSGGMPNDASTRVNDILIESQKMIYAPPSREKSKQTVRSPLLEKNNGKGSNIAVSAAADEYAQPVPTTTANMYPSQNSGGTAGGQRKKQTGQQLMGGVPVGKFQPNQTGGRQ